MPLPQSFLYRFCRIFFVLSSSNVAIQLSLFLEAILGSSIEGWPIEEREVAASRIYSNDKDFLYSAR